jgi:hypothetical protein
MHINIHTHSYYRAMFDPTQNSWNIRDTHFYLQYQRIRAHLQATRGHSPVTVWAHNSHLVSGVYIVYLYSRLCICVIYLYKCSIYMYTNNS